MAEVQETELPGLGVRYDFTSSTGQRLGVLLHRNGRRELLVYRTDDPDECGSTIDLDIDDARTLSELLGASRVVEQLTTLHHDVEGLTIDWIDIGDGAEWAGQTLAAAGVHSQTGVSIVALIGPWGSIAAPGADNVLEPGTTAVAIGSAEGTAEVARRLRGR